MGATAADRPVWIVVPCFQERDRLQPAHIEAIGADGQIGVVLVDDGSTDGTAELLQQIATGRDDVEVVWLGNNSGKGEAVRQGLLHALTQRPAWVGYADADMATPPSEVVRLADIALADDSIDVVLASRVAMLGHRIERSAWRHYTGRVFATGASVVLGKPVYDTQCGAKLFRAAPALDAALATPFRSRWGFDVELLGRLDRAGIAADRFREEPLHEWSDASGSKRGVVSSVRATLELAAIRRDLRRWEAP